MFLKRFLADLFRPGQMEAICSNLDGNDTLILIPTGGGKSLIYTIPAIIKRGLSIIIEPLKFIMEEQTDKLRRKHVPAFYFSSSLTEVEMEFTINSLSAKDVPYAILFTSPECVMSPRIQALIKKWNDSGQLNFIAVDEAHCIDVWGVGFRPDFLKLGLLKQLNVPVIALTGTATIRTQQVVVETLKMNKPKVVKVTSTRLNLFIEVIPKATKSKEQVVSLINNTFKDQKGIVYCLRRSDRVDLAQVLKTTGINSIFVHGDLPDSDRQKHKEAWEDGRAQVVCNKILWYGGVDKKDVRFTIHHSFPETIEDYYQEISRAGRDGLDSKCILLFMHEDRSFHLNNIMWIEDKVHKQYKYESMNKMVEYCENVEKCQHQLLLSHFQENAVDCDHSCDVCATVTDVMSKEYTTEALALIQGSFITIQNSSQHNSETFHRISVWLHSKYC